MYYKIRVTPEQSRQIQEICFKMGINWYNPDGTIRNIDSPFLFIEDSLITHSRSGADDFFQESKKTEISAKDFIKKYGKEKVKDLYNLEVNDVVICSLHGRAVVLAVHKNEEFPERTTYLLSEFGNFYEFGGVYTACELIADGLRIDAVEPTTTVKGVEFTKSELEDALKGME